MTKLGQHFLKNKIKLRKIAEALNVENGDIVVEIGPGHGELTNKIIERLKDLKIERFKIIAIEKDWKLAKNLKEKFQSDKNVEIIEGDALKMLPRIITNCKLQTINCKIVGNIPYYITGYLFRILSELKNKPSKIVLLIQKEVAQRICAPKYKQKMNLLALVTQFYADVKILFYISREDFQPAPKVDSAVVEIIPRQTIVFGDTFDVDKELFFKIIKAGFFQKRKLLINNLAKNLKMSKEKIEEIFKLAGVNPKSRAEDLSINDWREIVSAIERKNNNSNSETK